jgi:hypothetical protein
VVRFTPRPLYSTGKSLQYPLDRRMDGSLCRSGSCEEEKSLLPAENEPRFLGRSAPLKHWFLDLQSAIIKLGLILSAGNTPYCIVVCASEQLMIMMMMMMI